MITFEKVFKTYNNHRLIGIESYWFPSLGWKPFMEQQGANLSYEDYLMMAYKQGCKHVDLILENKTTGNPVWADFAMSELIQPGFVS